MNETLDSPAETKPDEQEINKSAGLAAKADIARSAEGDRMLDAMVQEHQQQGSPEIHGTAGRLFMGPGPGAVKSRHHRVKKSSETDADSSAEETEKTGDAVLASADAAPDSRLVQTLISSSPLPSTPALSLLPTVGLSTPSTVSKTTQTLVERITAPVGTTVNDLTTGITSAPRARLQSLVYTTQSSIPNISTVGTILGNTTTTLQAPVQTLTSQPLGTVPSVTGPVSSVTPTTPISGSPISAMVISPSSNSSVPVSSSSAPNLVASPSSTSSFGVSSTSVSSTTATFSSTAISPAVTTSVPTSLSSTLGTTIGPKPSFPTTRPGGH